MDKLPNFIIVGAGKSGTTSLYEYLKQHPQVFVSPVKETNFFALEGKAIEAQDTSEEQTEHYPWAINNYADYKKLFADVADEKAIGEVSPMYLYNERAPFAIKERLPSAKIICILRQPVERLYSRYMHLARENREPSGKFEDALDRSSIWWRRNDLVTEGFYGAYVKRYLDIFPRDQVKVFLYDDLRANQNKVIEEMFNFIAVDSSFKPETATEFNKSGKIKNKKLDAIIGQNSILVKGLNSLSPGLVASIKNSQVLKRGVNRLRNKNLEKAPLQSSLKKEMTDTIYKEDILSLQELLKRDLSHWLV